MVERSKGGIAVLVGTHGNEMEVGGRLEGKLAVKPISRVLVRNAHLEATRVRKRFLGTSPDARQLMSRYPGDPNGDPEQKAAYRNLHWLDKLKPIVVLDIHESTCPGSYMGGGTKVSLATLACGKELGYNKYVVDELPFFDSVPNSIYIENSLADNDPETIAERLYTSLERVSSINLQQSSYDDVTQGIIFYQKFEIPTAGEDGEILSWIPGLEKISIKPAFSPLELSDTQRTQLSIPSNALATYGSWGHDNMSNQVPERIGFTATGVPRREYFGSFFVQIAPPIPAEEFFLIFENETFQS